jgi:hypothetical protein
MKASDVTNLAAISLGLAFLPARAIYEVIADLTLHYGQVLHDYNAVR